MYDAGPFRVVITEGGSMDRKKAFELLKGGVDGVKEWNRLRTSAIRHTAFAVHCQRSRMDDRLLLR